MESFFSSLKFELGDQPLALDHYRRGVCRVAQRPYNRRRLHTSIGDSQSTTGQLTVCLLYDVMAALLYGVRPGEPTVFAGVVSGTALLTLLACLVPARRAAGVDPTENPARLIETQPPRRVRAGSTRAARAAGAQQASAETSTSASVTAR